VVSNEAVVHFPSVPEETPTNVVVNLVYPLIALPQQVEATVGQPLSIQLTGREANNSPLTYALVEQPLYGTLSGELPNLTYTPAAHAGGRLDRLVFTVNNGAMTSRPAEVTIQVKPNANDTQPPTILWTSPKSGEDVTTSSTLFFSGTEQLHGPVIQIQFSEMMNPESLLPANLQLLGPNGQPIEITLRYDSSLDQAVLLMMDAPQMNVEYTIVVTTRVTDLAGNPLAQEVRWSFQVAEAQAAAGELFLPAVQR
jgi:hypothetical protein